MSSQQSYYKEIALSPSLEDPRRLVFIAEQSAPPPPPELTALRIAYEEASRVIRVLFNDNQEARRQLFEHLHFCADRGLRGPSFSIPEGQTNLVDAQDSIVDRALAIRDKRFSTYNYLLVFLGIAPILLGLTISLTDGFGLSSSFAKSYQLLINLLVIGLFVVAGATIGVWTEFALRMHGGLAYDTLLAIDPGRWKPTQQVIIAIVVAFLLAFLLGMNFVQLGLGGRLLNDFTTKSPELALAVGGITGLAFPTVRAIIYKLKPEERK